MSINKQDVFNRVIARMTKDYKKLYGVKLNSINVSVKRKVINNILNNTDRLIKEQLTEYWYKHDDNVYFNSIGDRMVFINTKKSLHYQTYKLFVNYELFGLHINTLWKYRNEFYKEYIKDQQTFKLFIENIKKLINIDVERYGLDEFNKKMMIRKRIGETYATIINAKEAMFYICGVSNIDLTKIRGDAINDVCDITIKKSIIKPLLNKFRTYTIMGAKAGHKNDIQLYQRASCYN